VRAHKIIESTRHDINRRRPFPVATRTDVAAMGQRRLTDAAAGPADSRMAAYFNGQHHPQQALLPRVGYVALAGNTVVGYIAGHRTARHACASERSACASMPTARLLSPSTRVWARLLSGNTGTHGKTLESCFD
jgi:hypothetical protein